MLASWWGHTNKAIKAPLLTSLQGVQKRTFKGAVHLAQWITPYSYSALNTGIISTKFWVPPCPVCLGKNLPRTTDFDSPLPSPKAWTPDFEASKRTYAAYSIKNWGSAEIKCHNKAKQCFQDEFTSGPDTNCLVLKVLEALFTGMEFKLALSNLCSRHRMQACTFEVVLLELDPTYLITANF